MDNQQGPTIHSTWNSAQCYVAAWMGGEFEGERIHVYLWHFPLGLQSNFIYLFKKYLMKVFQKPGPLCWSVWCVGSSMFVGK